MTKQASNESRWIKLLITLLIGYLIIPPAAITKTINYLTYIIGNLK